MREGEESAARDGWQPARLIPTSGINGQDEAERRATSALLAVISAVREFGAALVRPLGAPAGLVESFIEVPFVLGERTVIPDGVMQVTRGSKTWTALVEVKTGSALLEKIQIESYLDVARCQGFDGVLTVSNQIAPSPGLHPVDVDRRKLNRVKLHHLSWPELLTIAVQQRVHRGVTDPDQAWILAELIRYLEHPRSGALDMGDMGPCWVPVRDSALAGTLRANDKGLQDVVSRWEQLLRFASLRLGRELGADVSVVLSRKEIANPSVRFAAQSHSLVGRGQLVGSLRIPNAIAPIDLIADVRAGKITVSIDIDAPRDGRALTRVNWLVRQLRDAPDGLRVDAWCANARSSTSELLKTLRSDPARLILDPQKELRTFRVAATSPLGSKRSTGRGGFIDSVLTAIDGFYAEVVQRLRPWAAKAPQLPKSGRTAAEDAGLELSPPASDLADNSSDDRGPEGRDELAAETEIEMLEQLPESEFPAATTTSDADELIDWPDAQERLDHERALETGETSPSVGR